MKGNKTQVERQSLVMVLARGARLNPSSDIPGTWTVKDTEMFLSGME